MAGRAPTPAAPGVGSKLDLSRTRPHFPNMVCGEHLANE
jgi:hypothetical protein